ncbi:hypothetical protein DUI87_31288 [Hirundo rustica rustica]|uniref:Uncharacterized protein n=1 Tax=Hirundo rustica rustica TaxID=333673 RepID=A0A3M0ITI6_HIRRU|nr:hypothetical protein DUI87_31288 [Hirundo rustica rustica]
MLAVAASEEHSLVGQQENKTNQGSAAPSLSRSQLLPASMALGWSRHVRSIIQDEVFEARHFLVVALLVVEGAAVNTLFQLKHVSTKDKWE